MSKKNLLGKREDVTCMTMPAPRPRIIFEKCFNGNSSLIASTKTYLIPNVVSVGRCNLKCIEQTGSNAGYPRSEDQEVPVAASIRDNKACYTTSDDTRYHEWNAINKK